MYRSFNATVLDIGKSLIEKKIVSSLETCQRVCDQTEGCKSIRYCPSSGNCFVKDKKLNGSEETQKKGQSESQCFTSFKSCSPGNDAQVCFKVN